MNESYYPPCLSGFFVFLLSSVILITSTILIFFRPTTPPVTAPKVDTSPWKTYTSKQLNFAIKYPNQARVCEVKNGLLIDQFNSESLCESYYLWLWSNQTPEKLISSMANPKHTSSLVSGQNTDIYEWISRGDSIREKLAIINTQTGYLFLSLNGTNENSLLVFNQILSTFKLLNQISPTPIPKTNTVSACKTGGCSSELCLEAGSPDRASICIYRNKYACLKYSVCEKQPNGKCGWTQTPEYLSCLKNLSQQTPPSF